MLKARSSDVAKNFGFYQDKALAEPVTVQKYNRDSVVIVQADEFKRLQKLDRQAKALVEMSERELKMLATSKMGEEHDHLNDLME